MTILKEKKLQSSKKNRPLVIDLAKVSKSYWLHHQKPTLVENISGLLRGQQAKEKFTAISNLNLKVYAGDKIGIYGPNGVGKSTLLKLIAGISSPTSGEIKVEGRVISLMDLTAGFHPDLTGEENILLNGLIVGMSKQEIESRKQAIIEFSGLGDFINVPLYTYSNGMKLRLGFSVAIHADPDILLLDEVISAGDEAFKSKTAATMKELFKNDKTVIIVSHWLDYLEKNCDRLIFLERTAN